MQSQSIKYQRLHSFSTKTNISQITVIVVVVLESTIFYSATISFLNEVQKLILMIIFSLSLGLMISFAVWTGQIDPTDQITKAYLINYKQSWQKFLRMNELTEQKNIIHCDKCRAKKQKHGAHCMLCDRCIQDQDHHCAFLNTCIGKKNYKHFVVTVVLTFTNFSTYIFCFGRAIFNFQQTPQYTLNNPQIIASIVAVAAVISAWIALAILLALHIFLNIKGLTTRQWIRGIKVPQMNQIIIRYPDLNKHQYQPKPIQTKSILPSKVQSTQTLPGLSQNSTNRHALFHNPTKNNQQNLTEKNYQNTIPTKIQPICLFPKNSGVEDDSAIQSLNQKNENQELVDDWLPNNTREQKLKGSSQKMIRHHVQSEEPTQKQLDRSETSSEQSSQIPKMKSRQENEQSNPKQMEQMNNNIQRSILGKKELKVRDFIVKNKMLSSFLGVNEQKPEELSNQNIVLNEGQNLPSHKLVKGHSVEAVKNNLSYELQKDDIKNKRRIKTVELDQKQIQLKVPNNRNQSKFAGIQAENMKLSSRNTIAINKLQNQNYQFDDFPAGTVIPKAKRIG